ncbi:LytTR family DNA-binding domain-containing protein [uncultured Agrobacterium sp.]|uniref:LytTR family DNA-binding domain-containing protein n=1 Tax=uncultured Agrobacterium sp. TaxID=157277 RepID=UPI0025DAC0E9|nr:LytTR family DNA-binding domain-containing protein [uncultured Agrobacterium sp.]
MDHPYLLSTLRRMHTTLQSRRLWLTFFAILAIFILTGPFGTSETMSFADRLLYWTIVQAGAWILAITFSTVASDILAGSINNMLARMMIGSVAAAMPIGLLLAVTNHVFFGKDLDFASASGSAISALPLCVIFCLLSYLAVCQSLPAAEEPADAGENEGKSDVPLLERLPPQKRGALLRLSVEDHYTEIVTTRGRELVLLRFADALREIGRAQGLQVHRSHWVADAGVVALSRKSGRLCVVMQGGEEIPVSRPYTSAVQARFAALAPAR